MQVTRTQQQLDPTLARHAPRRLAARVKKILGRAWEAEQVLARKLEPLGER